MLDLEVLENNPGLKDEFEKQGLELINVKFIDDETSIFITRKKKNKLI